MPVGVTLGLRRTGLLLDLFQDCKAERGNHDEIDGLSRPEDLDPTGTIDIAHHGVGDRELALRTRARKPATAFTTRLRVVDMPCTMPPGDMIYFRDKVAVVQAKEVLTHTRYSRYSILF
jgi:hypothetical protein